MIKIVSKTELSPLKQNLLRILAVIIALFAAGLIMLCLKLNPFEVYGQIIKGSLNLNFRSSNVDTGNDFLNGIFSLKDNIFFVNTVSKAIPLLILSLGISVAFKMKFWNIGAEGQFYFGAFGASLFAFNMSSLPAYILIPLMFIVGFIFGGIWAVISAVLKLKFSTSETLVTLMLNYIAIAWIKFLENDAWGDSMGQIPSFTSNAILPKVFNINIGWIIALILVVIVYILLKYTKLGYEVSVLGESHATARYAGMNVTKITIIAILISGGICGLAGVIQVSASSTSSLSSSLSGGLGFTAVITTWLAQLSAPVIIITSFLFAMLIQGSTTLQISLGISASTADIIQGIILFFVLGSEFFLRYKLVFHKKAKTVKEVK